MALHGVNYEKRRIDARRRRKRKKQEVSGREGMGESKSNEGLGGGEEELAGESRIGMGPPRRDKDGQGTGPGTAAQRRATGLEAVTCECLLESDSEPPDMKETAPANRRRARRKQRRGPPLSPPCLRDAT